MPAEAGNHNRPPSIPPGCEMRLVLENRLDELKRLQSFLEAFSRQNGLTPELHHAMDLALTEWITNVISHGLPPGGEQSIEIKLVRTPSEIQAEIVDTGYDFDPLQHPSVDISVPLDDKPVGGLGIHIMRQLMDRVTYHREHGKNRLLLMKRLSRALR